MRGQMITTILAFLMGCVGITLWSVVAQGEINLLISVLIAIPMLTIIACAFYPDFWSWFFFFYGITTAYAVGAVTSGDWGSHWGPHSSLSSVCIPIGSAWLHIHHWAEGMILLGIAVRPIVHYKRLIANHYRGAKALFWYGVRLWMVGGLFMIGAVFLYAQHFTDARRSIWCVLAWSGAFIGPFLGSVCMSREYHSHSFRICLGIGLGVSIGVISSGAIEVLQEMTQKKSVPSTLIFYSDKDERCSQ